MNKPIFIHMAILARQLRLAVVTNVFEQGLLDEEAARELLALPLVPGDDSTIYDDSALLGDCLGLAKIASGAPEPVADGGESKASWRHYDRIMRLIFFSLMIV